MGRRGELVRLAFVLEAVLVAFQKDVGLFGTGYTLFVYILYPFPPSPRDFSFTSFFIVTYSYRQKKHKVKPNYKGEGQKTLAFTFYKH